MDSQQIKPATSLDAMAMRLHAQLNDYGLYMDGIFRSLNKLQKITSPNGPTCEKKEPEDSIDTLRAISNRLDDLNSQLLTLKEHAEQAI